MIYDISMPIKSGMKVYKNKTQKQPIIKTVMTHDEGSVHETDINLNLHTGTHVDAPLHMIDGGDTVEVYDLQLFIGDALVIDLVEIEGGINKAHLLDYQIKTDDIILLKTRNSYDEVFNYDFTYLEASGAIYLKEIGVKLVGIDALGIERNQQGHITHKTLLGSGIPIVEGLMLKDVPPGRYEFIGFPLSIPGVEASLIRAVLRGY